MRGHAGVPRSLDPPLEIVLVAPEIPGNTGSVGRLAMATRCPLHLVEPLGFSTDDKHLRRAGLDYWKSAEVYTHASFDALRAALPGRRFHLLTARAPRSYVDVRFERGDLLVFGRETSGLDRALVARHPEACCAIPMWNEARSLNLANAVSIVLFEGLRQLGLLTRASAPAPSPPDGSIR